MWLLRVSMCMVSVPVERCLNESVEEGAEPALHFGLETSGACTYSAMWSDSYDQFTLGK